MWLPIPFLSCYSCHVSKNLHAPCHLTALRGHTYRNKFIPKEVLRYAFGQTRVIYFAPSQYLDFCRHTYMYVLNDFSFICTLTASSRNRENTQSWPNCQFDWRGRRSCNWHKFKCTSNVLSTGRSLLDFNSYLQHTLVSKC